MKKLKKRHFKKWLKKNWFFVYAPVHPGWSAYGKTSYEPITNEMLERAFSKLKELNVELEVSYET